MAHMWRMLQAGEEMRYGFHNGYASQRGYNGVGRAGYAIQVVRVGHLNCKCMLSGDLLFSDHMTQQLGSGQ